MVSFEKNPYAWKEENITGTVASLSFTRMNGTVIPVENLPKEIEVTSKTFLHFYTKYNLENICRSSFSYLMVFQILLPRLDVGQQNYTVLDLTNFSTLMIDIPSPEVTLVLKMEPSEDISFMVFLGSKVYPHDKSYVAKTQLPQENTNKGTEAN